MPTINGKACVANGRNLLTGTGSHTVTGRSVSGYLSNETTDDLLTLFQGLEGQTLTVSVDYEYSGFIRGSGGNRLGWEIHLFSSDRSPYFGLWYDINNDSGSGSGRLSKTFVVPKNISGIEYASGFIQFSGSGTGTLSHLKLEKGSVATPLTPAPVDKVFSNGRQVYGRNLLPNTNQGLTNWRFGHGDGGSYNKNAFDVPNGKGMSLATTVTYSNWFWLGYKLNYKVLKQNTDYVLRFWAMSDIDRRVDIVKFANGAGSNMAAIFSYFDLKAKQKTRIVLKAKTNDVAFTDQMIYFPSFKQIGSFDIWDLQLVEGTNALIDWTPAPEDVM